ncbi:hypothetical protein [Loktanella sp. M215]|uniref:hypothetical protein n=1 Tax=Loktanella sp. M215 TaxID=2675431 RepID=UPI001F3F35B8|nr:hypothetical protein [Loktanella sp. M215]MCF7699911.1 hypothetical protein [Loktanella sp. M215]
MPPSDRTKTARCPSCDAPLTMAQRDVTGHCGTPHCARRHGATVARATALRQQARDDARAATIAAPLRAAAARAVGTADAEVQIVRLPYQNEPVTPLPEATRTAFLTALRSVVEAACASAPDQAQDDAEVADIPASGVDADRDARIGAAACTACQGRCCRLGLHEHAFLRERDIARRVRLHPDLTPAAIMAHYTAALPALSSDGSCVYHGATGCVLSRDWRSDTCNAYRCPSLSALVRDNATGKGQAFLFVALNADQAQVMAYRDGGPAIPLDRPLPPAKTDQTTP